MSWQNSWNTNKVKRKKEEKENLKQLHPNLLESKALSNIIVGDKMPLWMIFHDKKENTFNLTNVILNVKTDQTF